jgi:hypothetical protein
MTASHGSPHDKVIAWRPPDTGQAELAKGILEQEGINPFIEGSYTSVATFGLNVKMWVRRHEVERTREILSAYGFLEDEDGSDRKVEA